MEPHQHRVHLERGDLYEKISRLSSFMGSDRFGGVPDDEKARMMRQLGIMQQYLQVLDDRIAHFGRS